MKRVLSLGVVIAMLTSCSGSSDNQGYLANAEYIPVYPVDGTNYDMLAPDVIGRIPSPICNNGE